MNFNFPLLKTVRILLFPFSLLYFVIIWIRNQLFDTNILKSSPFNLPLICVGNLTVGGTGKSPMVEYLIRLLKNEFNVATLSRGYKRKTRGYALATSNTTALDVGDEPMQFHLKFPEVAVTVGEARLEAIPQLLHDKPDTDVILLDDAFQHRYVKAGLNILLTDYNNLYTRDWFLPAGDLRDQRSSAKRAQIIVVTKCKASISTEEKKSIEKELKPSGRQRVFFSTIQYGAPYHITLRSVYSITQKTEVLLVTGIANPLPLKRMLNEQARAYYQLAYNDHHIFTIDDLKEILTKFGNIQAEEKVILTTEKDAVRLMKFEQELKDLPFYVIPIEQSFLFRQAPEFNNLVQSFIRNFK
ncbi:MAG: tetraacyldisaccharide 4'-kinase [Chitinophagaceae bacterium]|nr:tetraacyldisaccharide 4'-kinase [Chitinophagaceae bacterium]